MKRPAAPPRFHSASTARRHLSHTMRPLATKYMSVSWLPHAEHPALSSARSNWRLSGTSHNVGIGAPCATGPHEYRRYPWESFISGASRKREPCWWPLDSSSSPSAASSWRRSTKWPSPLDLPKGPSTVISPPKVRSCSPYSSSTRRWPAPAISDWLSREASTARYAPGTTFQIGKIDLLANTGTYIDAPFHRYEDGRDVAGYALEAVADLAGVVVRASVGNKRAIDASRFKGEDVKGKAVLVHTGWDAHWRTDTYSGGQHPFLTKDAAEYLAKAGAALV